MAGLHHVGTAGRDRVAPFGRHIRGTRDATFEEWRYRYLEGVGDNVNMLFVDRALTGEYQLEPGKIERLSSDPQ